MLDLLNLQNQPFSCTLSISNIIKKRQGGANA